MFWAAWQVPHRIAIINLDEQFVDEFADKNPQCIVFEADFVVEAKIKIENSPPETLGQGSRVGDTDYG